MEEGEEKRGEVGIPAEYVEIAVVEELEEYKENIRKGIDGKEEEKDDKEKDEDRKEEEKRGDDKEEGGEEKPRDEGKSQEEEDKGEDEEENKDDVEEEEQTIYTSGWSSPLGNLAEQMFRNQEEMERAVDQTERLEENNNQASKKVEKMVKVEKKVRVEKKKVSMQQVIRAFSAVRNLKKIFRCANRTLSFSNPLCSIGGSSEELNCLHGIRFLSMTW